jgi:hypothetical protein
MVRKFFNGTGSGSDRVPTEKALSMAPGRYRSRYHTRQDKAGQFRESPQRQLGGFSLRPSPLSWRTCSQYCKGPACLNHSRPAHPHSWRLRRLNTICWKRLADASLYARRHSTLHRFNFLRQFAAEQSFRRIEGRGSRVVSRGSKIEDRIEYRGSILSSILNPRSQ